MNADTHEQPEDPPAGLSLVWDGDAPLVIETVTVRRMVRQESARGARVFEMCISLPRVRFLEDIEDPTPHTEDELDSTTLAEGDDLLPLAA